MIFATSRIPHLEGCQEVVHEQCPLPTLWAFDCK